MPGILSIDTKLINVSKYVYFPYSSTGSRCVSSNVNRNPISVETALRASNIKPSLNRGSIEVCCINLRVIKYIIGSGLSGLAANTSSIYVQSNQKQLTYLNLKVLLRSSNQLLMGNDNISTRALFRRYILRESKKGFI
jgi:hypothetical protein